MTAEFGTAISQWAGIAASVATVLALFAVWVQLRHATMLQEQAAARDLYSSFLAFVAENPGSLTPPAASDIPGSQYDWTLFLWLTALESGWRAFRGSPEWERRLHSFAYQHLDYVESDYWKTYVHHEFEPGFVAAVNRAVAEMQHFDRQKAEP